MVYNGREGVFILSICVKYLSHNLLADLVFWAIILMYDYGMPFFSEKHDYLRLFLRITRQIY